MGVLSCNRKGCENIMCHRHSYEYGYICSECFDELVNSGPTTDIEQFMNGNKKHDTHAESYSRYNVVFESSR